MISPLFISATGTDVGKTYVATALVHLLASFGLRVGVFKPIETGVENVPLDAMKLLQATGRTDILLDDVCPLRFPLPAAPAIARDSIPIDYTKIMKSYQKIADSSDIVVIEGAGGLMTPIDKEKFMADFATIFHAHVVFISHGKLGCINDIVLAQEALEKRNLSWTLFMNIHNNDNYETISAPYLNERYEGKIMTTMSALAHKVLHG